MTPQQALIKIGECQTQVELPVKKFKRKEYQTLQGLIDAIVECIELLEKEGINSKGLVKEKLEAIIK